MLSLVPGKELFNVTFKHVRDLFGGPTESDSSESTPTQSQSQSQSLPPESPSQSFHTVSAHTETHAAPSESASMNVNAEVKRRIQNRIFDGTFDDGIEVSDDDDVQEISPPKANSRTTPTTKKSDKQIRVTRVNRDQRTTPLEKEKEAAQSSSHYFQDSIDDRVRVKRTTRSMPFGRQGGFTSATSGLRVTNTLDVSKPSSKQKHYNSNVQRPPAQSTPTAKQAQLRQPHPATQKETRPFKRQRTGSPERNSEHHTHSRLGLYSANVRSAEATASEGSLSAAYGISAADVHPAEQISVKRTPLRELALELPLPNEGRKVTRLNSPDDLFDINNADHDEGQFTKSAREERQTRPSDSDNEHNLQSELRSTRTSKSLSTSLKGRDSAKPDNPNRTAKHSTTPRVSKMSSRLGEESPDVLQTSVNTSVRPMRKFASPSRSPPLSAAAGMRFKLARFICKPFVDVGAYNVEVDEKRKILSILYENAQLTKEALAPIPIPKIIQMLYPADENTNIVMLKLSDRVLPENKCFLDFGNSLRARSHFINMVLELDSGIKTSLRGSKWIESAVHSASTTNEHHPQAQEQTRETLNQDGMVSHATERPAGSQRTARNERIRKVDQLDEGPVKSDVRAQQAETVRAPRSTTKYQNLGRTAEPEAVLPVVRTRETRSRASKPPQESTDTTTIPLDIEPRRVGPAWENPLVYPSTGKSRATVTWDDLERLNDDEFLNDNLVALFMRYLQEHMDQGQAKKMHFFNTFFYNSLTRSNEKGRSRSINYQAVANWTKTVNLFNRDYVVVPVNEAAHWYVMIICNLRTIKEPLDRDADEDVVEIRDPAEEDDEIVTNTSRIILESDVLVKPDSPKDSDYGEQLRGSEQAPTRKRPGRRKSQQTRRKYPLNEPIIITLDSLDQGRSSTASALKSYLVAEAKDKYDLDIDKETIKGMTAKSIPLQGNFSDCGLYLCMYLEQFVRDPKTFVRSILQREEGSFPWPSRMQNGVLRQRLYDMLQTLYRIQSNKKAKELPPIGRILIHDADFLSDKRVSAKDIYDPQHVRDGLDYYHKHQVRENKISTADDMLLEDGNHPSEHDLQAIGASNGVNGGTSEPIIIGDSQEPVQTRDGTSSRYFPPYNVGDHPKAAANRLDSPLLLAKQMARARSPGKYLGQADTHTTIDITTPISQTSLRRPLAMRNTTEQSEREISCSTDFLTGDRTYQGDQTMQHASGDTHRYGRDEHMQDVDQEFHGFDGDEGVHSRDTSFVADSIESENGDMIMMD